MRATLVAMLRRQLGLVAAPVLLGLAVAGCGDDGVDSDAGRFCAEAAAQRDRIIAPPMATEEQLTATLAFFRTMGELAPLAISEQWDTLVTAMETASTVVPGDPDSEQQAALAAYASERSAYEVAVWLKRYCNVDIPITTIAPQDAIPARTTTLPPAPGDTTVPPD